MSEFPPKYNVALVGEINRWCAEGIIGADAVTRLTAMYPPAPPASGRLISILMNLGAILVGLGGLLFISSNWEHMGSALKVVTIVSAIVSAYFAAWQLRFEPGNHPKLGTAMLILGSLFYGGGIFLISQIFNFDNSLENCMMQWAVGVGLCALVTASAPLAILFSLLISFWTFVGTQSLLIFGLAFAAAIFVAYKLRSPAAVAVTLVSGASWISLLGKTGEWGLIFYGAALFLAYLWHRKRWQLMTGPHLYVGTTSALLGLLIATFDKSVIYNHINLNSIAPLFIAMLVMGYLASLDDKKAQIEVIGCVAVSIVALLLASITGDTTRLALCNLLLISSIVALVWTGVNHLQNVGLVNLAIGFFVLDIVSRYFDFFFSMLDRSFFFVIGGIVLMAAGYVADRSRRKIIEGFAT
jgi:uncharacterized membrane protein